MSKPSLEKLLEAFSKTEKRRDETEALKLRLEAEINERLDSGDGVSEQIAQALQIKRGQFDLCPGKIAQLSARLASLTTEIQAELAERSIPFSRELQAVGNVAKDKLRAVIIPMLPELAAVDGEGIVQFIFPRTKLSAKITGLDSIIQFQLWANKNPVAAARQLLVAEKELAGLKIEKLVT